MCYKTLSAILIACSVVGLLLIAHADAQSITYHKMVTIDSNERYGYHVVLKQNETMVCWLRFQSGEGVYAYILNSTEHEASQWSQPANNHGTRIFENTSSLWQHWNFSAPYDDEWYLYFSKWSGEPYAESPCEIEILVGVWMSSASLQVVVTESPFAGDFDISISLISRNNSIGWIEIYIDGILNVYDSPPGNFSFMYVQRFVFDSRRLSNGNHSLRVVAYDSIGNRLADWESQIQVENGFFDDSSNLLIILLLYILIVFVISMVAFREWGRPADENKRWLHAQILFFLGGIMSMLIGTMEVPGLDIELNRGIGFLVGLILVNLAGLFSTYYISTRLDSTKTNSLDNRVSAELPLKESNKENQQDTSFELNINQILSRSDILDKVRGNIRTGTAVVMGIGSGIFWWLLSLGRPLASIESAFLIASGGLAFFSAAGLLVSFSHVTKDERTGFLGEDLLPSTQSKEEYTRQLATIVRTKAQILSQIRQAIGVGLLWFIVFALLGASLPIYFATTLASSIPLIAMSTLVPLGIMAMTIGRFTQIVIGPSGFALMNSKSQVEKQKPRT
jgi:hypothetical protein